MARLPRRVDCRRRRHRRPESNAPGRKKSISFFRIILQETIDKKKLRMPSKLGNLLVGDAIKITVADGRVWRVGLVKEHGDFWVKNNFHEFMQYYSIGFGYFLIFECTGVPCFRVRIYDPTTFQIEYPSNCSDDEASDDDDSVKKTSPPPPNPCKGESSSKKMHDQVEVIDSSDEEATAKDNLNEKEVEVIVSAKYDLLKLRVSPSCRRAIDAAESYQPKSSAFRVILGARDKLFSYVPSKFAHKYMRRTDGYIVVEDPQGREWLVKIRKRDRGGFDLGSGWSQLFLRNNLKLGDVCVFEIMDSNNFTLKLSVFPA